MYNMIHVMENVTNMALVGMVVLMVMFSKNGQSSSNQMGMNLMGTMSVGLIVWVKSDKGGSGLTGEYGQLIMEYSMMATILSVLAMLIMNSAKEKKGMEWMGLIFLATLGMFLNGAEDLLTVYLAMEAHSLAFYKMTLGVLAMTMVLWPLADMKMGMLYMFVVFYLSAYAVLCSVWASNSSYNSVLGFYTEYSAVFLVLFLLSEYADVILMSYFNGLLFWGGWLPIINLAPFTWIPEVVWLGIKVSFLFIWTYASFPSMSLSNFMHLEWKSFFIFSQANVETPVNGFVFLAGALLKLGAYGFKLHSYCIHFVSSAFFKNFLNLIGLMGSFSSNPVLATSFTVSLISLQSMLPLSGFFGTWLVFSSTIHSQFDLLAIFGVLSSAFYYLRLIKLMYLQDSSYCIHFVSSVFSIYTFFLQLYSLLLAVSMFMALLATSVIFSVAYSFFF